MRPARLVRRAPALVVALVLSVIGLVPPAAAAATPDELNAQILDSLGRSTASQIAAQVTVDGVGQVTYLRPDLELLPASTQKLSTVGAALLELGPDWVFRTEVSSTGPILGPVLFGDLVLDGGGDPTLTGFNLQELANAVAAQGVRRITGDLVVDDTLFDRVRTAPGWKAGWMPRYVGPLSAVAVDRNAYRSDTTFLADPALVGGQRFRDALAAAGVSLRGAVRVGTPTIPPRPPIAVHDTPVTDVARRILKSSDNFAAEQLLKAVATRIGVGSTGGGVEVVNLVRERLGLRRIATADGSGLSLLNRATVNHQVTWLWRVSESPVAGVFHDSLAVACVDGTLVRRMCGTAAAGKTYAKTGYLAGVVTLAGYTTTANGRKVAFSFLLNGVRDVTAAREAIDRAVALVAGATL